MRKHLKRLAKLSLEEYKSAYCITDNLPRCVICGTKQGKRKLAQDHCHVLGIKRGKLCSMCNSGLGMFKDEPSLLVIAAKYLIYYGKHA